MKRFLRTPVGWFALLFVEFGVLVVVARGLMRVFPGRSTTVSFGILTLGAALVVANYLVRRRYLT